MSILQDLATSHGARRAAPLAGSWKLEPGRAVTLSPPCDGILRVAQGQVWATVDGPHGRGPADSGDHVLAVGRSMWLRAGQRVVLEPWGPGAGAHFRWDPVFAPLAVPQPRPDWSALRQPLADLRQAAGLAAAAFGQLALGLARVASGALPGRGLSAVR